jgi:hypothetical protein
VTRKLVYADFQWVALHRDEVAHDPEECSSARAVLDGSSLAVTMPTFAYDEWPKLFRFSGLLTFT